MFDLREKERYGIYSLCIPETGQFKIELDIAGFGESLTVFDEQGECVFSGEYCEGIQEDYEETDDSFIIFSYELRRELELKKDDMIKLENFN